MVKFRLVCDGKSQVLEVPEKQPASLPRLESEGRSFLGWNRYAALPYGYMSASATVDTTLHAIYTDGPAYILESHFRGVPKDDQDERCHFRRYVIDVYLEHAVADRGEFRVENCNHILYYLGHVPVADVKTTVEAVTDQREGPYHGEGYITTSDITVHWESKQPIDATNHRQKIATLLLCFSKWEMNYGEIERRTSDEIIVPARSFAAMAGEQPALVSANFYNGIVLEEPPRTEAAALVTVGSEDELPEINFGAPLARFAVLADSHVGSGYKWKDYEWLYGVFAHLERLHQTAPLDFVLQLGDNIDNGYANTYQPDYETYLDVIRRLTICDPEHPVEACKPGTIPHYEIQGNHDTSMDLRFFRQKLWYTENAAGEKVAFIAFFSKYGGYPAVNFSVSKSGISYKSYGILADEMVDFVEQSIVAAREQGAKHIVLCSHFGIAQDLAAPVLPESGLGRIEQLCEKYNVRLYLNGHEHNKPYALRKYHNLYDYDAAMTRDGYAVFELYERYAKVTVYRTTDHAVDRIDVIEL